MNQNNSPNADNWPTISVVVPIRNEERYIAQTLGYLLKQDYPAAKLEIIVVDGCSDDRTVEIVQSIASAEPRVKILNNPKRLSSAARNIGAKAAIGEIVTFIDGHVFIDNDKLLKNTASLMADNKVAVLSRPQFLDTPENTFFQKAVAVARKSAFGHGLDSTIYAAEERHVDPTSSGASYKKEVFAKVGYFDEAFDAAEDVEFNYRVGKAGFQSFTSLKLGVYYFPRASLKGLFRQLSRYGTGRFRFMRKHREAISSGALIPALYFIGLAVLIVAAIVKLSLWPVPAIYGGLYVLGNLAASLLVSAKHGLGYLFVLPPIYFCIHFGLAYGFIREAVRTIFKSR